MVRNPLLASLGRDAREPQLRLGACDVAVTDEHLPLRGRPATLLGRLQHAPAGRRAVGSTPAARPNDRSLQGVAQNTWRAGLGSILLGAAGSWEAG